MIAQGDKCWVQSVLKKHYGICTGHDADGRPWFVHNTIDGVVHTPLEGFATGREIHVAQSAPPGQEARVAARALKLVGQRYDLLTFNCEHVANLAANGKAESKQVQGAVAAVAGAVLLAIINQNGTWVDSNGYRRGGGGRFASRLWW